MKEFDIFVKHQKIDDSDVFLKSTKGNIHQECSCLKINCCTYARKNMVL